MRNLLVLDRESFAYTTLWELLTAHQRRFLTGVALEPSGVKPFSSEFTRHYGTLFCVSFNPDNTRLVCRVRGDSGSELRR